MNSKLIDSNEIHTSEGIFKRDIIIHDLTDYGCCVSTSLYFNDKEYKDVDELKSFLGDDAFEKMRSEVEVYSSALDCFLAAYPRIL